VTHVNARDPRSKSAVISRTWPCSCDPMLERSGRGGGRERPVGERLGPPFFWPL